MIGGQVGFAGHITIGDNVKIRAQSGISKSVKDNEVINGTPAFGFQILINHMFILKIYQNCIKIK